MIKEQDDLVIEQALSILSKRMKVAGDLMGRHIDVRNFIAINVASLEHEVFGAILLDQAGHYITHEVLFRGTLLESVVYGREIVKFALKHNASKIIFFHNHPGGSTKPSPRDIELTHTLKRALEVMDVVVLDHIIAAGTKTYSFKYDGGHLT